MHKFYQVFQSHSPSGGCSPVDQTRYATKEEAQAEAKRLLDEVDVFNIYNCGGQELTFPSFWPQPLREGPDGGLIMEFE